MATTIETIRTPPGTYGLAVAPWSADEVYAVAADWAQASSPVLAWLGHDWDQTAYQVADYRHSDRAALEQIIQDAIEASGSSDDDDAAEIARTATRIGPDGIDP